jgi:signal transduction histidine kinase
MFNRLCRIAIVDTIFRQEELSTAVQISLKTRDIRIFFDYPSAIVSTGHNNQKDIKILEISLKDTGTGIFESDLTKVFDPYFKTKAMGVQKGVGLGLAASHAIVTRHGGRNIVIDSGAGRGTIVIVS